MTIAAPNLAQLARPARPAAVPRPASRWKTRVLIPAAVAMATLALFGYAARGLLWPAIDVWVVPVIAAPDSAQGRAGSRAPAAHTLVQAPGWIEPSPYATTVPALAEGVVKEVLVLEGERLEVGQVVARLIDDDARLAVQRAQAELHEQQASVDQAIAAADAAQAREQETRVELNRKEPLVAAGGVPAGQVAQLRARLEAAKLETAAARKAVVAAESAIERRKINLREASLRLERMEVRSPIAGVVLSRLVEPGARLSMGQSDGSMRTAVIRLYDPSRLQVRVDVPLADAAKVGIGSLAQIVTEALPDRVFRGTVSRVMHEANIQRNTVQMKVSIEDPSPTLKPEMLARVRLSAPPTTATDGAADGTDPRSAAPASQGSSGALLVLADALRDARDGKASVWLVDLSGGARGARAAPREITTARNTSDGYAIVTSGLTVGDRVIVDPPAELKQGVRVRVLGEKTTNTNNEPR